MATIVLIYMNPSNKKKSNILSTENNLDKYMLNFKRGQLYQI